MTKRNISQSTRRHILFRDKRTCRYCGTKEGERFDGKPLADEQALLVRYLPHGMVQVSRLGICVLTIDHIIPVSRGGSNLYVNLVAACQPCNNRKADMTIEEAGMSLLGEPMTGHREGWQQTIILVKGAEFFGE